MRYLSCDPSTLEVKLVNTVSGENEKWEIINDFVEGSEKRIESGSEMGHHTYSVMMRSLPHAIQSLPDHWRAGRSSGPPVRRQHGSAGGAGVARSQIPLLSSDRASLPFG